MYSSWRARARGPGVRGIGGCGGGEGEVGVVSLAGLDIVEISIEQRESGTLVLLGEI